MRMIAKYYTKITFTRMAELLDYPVDVSYATKLLSWSSWLFSVDISVFRVCIYPFFL